MGESERIGCRTKKKRHKEGEESRKNEGGKIVKEV